MPAHPFHLFERYGVELEYMIVDAADADAADFRPADMPWAAPQDEVRHGAALVNELVMHVIKELKTDTAARSMSWNPLSGRDKLLNGMLVNSGSTAIHPWMDPHRETRLWPHGNKTMYKTFDRIFDTTGTAGPTCNPPI